MNERKYNAVLFDLDGTLLDTIGDIYHNVNYALKEMGYPTHTKEEVRSFVNNGALDLMTKALPEYARDRENVERVIKRYLEIYDMFVSVNTVPYDGICQVVSRLKQEGYKLAVVSNKPERHVKFLAEKFFGTDTFLYISGTGLDTPVKPSRECVDRALESIGACREETVFAGDSNVDVLTGKNSQLFTVGVTWGFHGTKSFGVEQPDVFVHDAAELYNVITGNIL